MQEKVYDTNHKKLTDINHNLIKNNRRPSMHTGNYGDNILRLFDVWPDFPVTTSETNRDH